MSARAQKVSRVSIYLISFFTEENICTKCIGKSGLSSSKSDLFDDKFRNGIVCLQTQFGIRY